MKIKSILDFTKPYLKYRILSIIFLILSGVLNLLLYIFVAEIIVHIFLNNDISNNYIIRNSLYIFLTYAIKTVLNLTGLYFSHNVAYGALADIRIAVVNKIARISLGNINKKNYGDYKKIIADNVDDLEVYLAHMIPEGIADSLNIIISFVFLFLVDYRMALSVLIVIPFGYISLMTMFKIGMKNITKYYAASKNVNNNIIEYFNGMGVIKVFSASDKAYQKYSNSIRELTKETLSWIKSTAVYVQIYQVLFSTTFLFALPLGLYFYVSKSIELSNLTLSLMIALGLVNPLINFMKFMPVLGTINEKGKDILEILNEEELKNVENDVTVFGNNIKINHLTFKYDKEIVLNDINLEFESGSFNAIVGESGSGKSTIFKLIMRMWDYEDGDIFLDNVSIQDIPFDKLMDMITYVSQDNFLFNMSIKDNIKIGKPSASEDEVINAAKLARCHDFIMSLPDSYDTMFSSVGTNLSGGEKQRIAIARAMIKNAPIVLLDEATSAIDPENENEIQQALEKLVKNKTLIVIAHKLSTVVKADKIVVLNKGEIDMYGKHDYLLQNSNIYKSLWNSSQVRNSWNIN